MKTLSYILAAILIIMMLGWSIFCMLVLYHFVKAWRAAKRIVRPLNQNYGTLGLRPRSESKDDRIAWLQSELRKSQEESAQRQALLDYAHYGTRGN